jgi:hypothetical protein
MDKRKFNKGTKGNKGGRKPKAEELKALEHGLAGIEAAYGSVEEYWTFIAKESKESFAHLKLIHEYVYGKAKETKDLNVSGLPKITIEEI